MHANRERRYDYAASGTIKKQAGRFREPLARHNPGVGNATTAARGSGSVVIDLQIVVIDWD
ncbi:MAG: hypothetical protein DMG58_23290 [Acidobacteria bacterium]|nr:MAG: hypothetical protein DMG58_23290 [Acidobacteriota bacterium]